MEKSIPPSKEDSIASIYLHKMGNINYVLLPLINNFIYSLPLFSP